MARATILNSVELRRDGTIVLDFSMALVEGNVAAIVNGLRRNISSFEVIADHLKGLNSIFEEAGYPKIRRADRALIRNIRDIADGSASIGAELSSADEEDAPEGE
jgi:hypothetical protein